MEPTDAGRLLYEKAKNIVMLVDESYKDLEAYAKGVQGTVRLGMTQAYPDTDMTRLLLRFQRENPQLHYEIFECGSGEILELLRTGVIETGIIRISGSLPPFINERLSFQQHLCVYCCYSNPWISPYEKEIPLVNLDCVPLAISRGFESVLRDSFQRAGINPVIMSVSTSRSNPVMWAKAGAMAAIVCTEEASSFNDAEAFCRPLVSEDPAIANQLCATRSFVVAKDRRLSSAAERFLSFSRSNL